MGPNACVEAFSGHFGVFDVSPKDPVKRSLKKLTEGTQRMCADWTATRKVGVVRVVDALASRDGSSRGHLRAFSPRSDGGNLKRLRRTLTLESVARVRRSGGASCVGPG